MTRAIKALCLLLLFAEGGVVCGQGAGQTYAVVADESDIHWVVYKAGALKRVGHNHAIAVGTLRGTVWRDAADLSASRFELDFAVAELTVDDPALRATLGADFASVPTADDIAGTRRNMLGEDVLRGAEHPTIRIAGTGPVTRDGVQTLAVRVELLGRTVALTLPTRVSFDGDELRAVGVFDLDHADLGLKPFKALLGALQVSERLSFSYEVVARLEPLAPLL
jgi:hypothetical protein